MKKCLNKLLNNCCLQSTNRRQTSGRTRRQLCRGGRTCSDNTWHCVSNREKLLLTVCVDLGKIEFIYSRPFNLQFL